MSIIEKALSAVQKQALPENNKTDTGGGQAATDTVQRAAAGLAGGERLAVQSAVGQSTTESGLLREQSVVQAAVGTAGAGPNNTNEIINIPFDELQRAVIEFESCNGCDQNRYPDCYNESECTDMLKMFRTIAPHHQKMRSLIRRFYDLRNCNMWITELDWALSSGSWDCLQKFISTSDRGMSFECQRTVCVCISVLVGVVD